MSMMTFSFQPFSGTLSQKRSVYETFTLVLMFQLLGALASWEIPVSGSPPHLCTEAICSLQGWTLAVSVKVCFCGSAPRPHKRSRAAETHTCFHTGWKPLCANMPGFANLFLGLALLALHPWSLGLGFARSVHRGFPARVCSW